ncbi:TIM-barrel domain-containing protein [Parafilimonas sp.]|uniref:TIM-barrel domain-containing protein n=1 Tax=Parafilimonas sp. TaxID=1969739 RepID=UPI0039E4B489
MKKLLTVLCCLLYRQSIAQTIAQQAKGIWKITFGTPEQHLPTTFKEAPLSDALNKMAVDSLPSFFKNIRFKHLPSGVVAEMNVDDSERFYGFGMQTNTFEQRGMRREIRTNASPVGNLGFGHAAMPFFISSRGYGILVNTSRYTTFYMASANKMDPNDVHTDSSNSNIKLSVEDLYGSSNNNSASVQMLVEDTQGMEVYFIDGPTMLNVMQRYNLFSGGGALPPLWGLGFEYRAKGDSKSDDVENMADYFRAKHIPCDIIGLEPGWQTNAYSCSFAWNTNNFPQPESFIRNMRNKSFKLNLWEHAYTSPSSPVYKNITTYSGNYKVWNGAVPDFTLQQAQNIFYGYHDSALVQKGIAAFKLDECDGAEYTSAQGEWSFPDITRFPGGMDGIQMRQLFGYLYQKGMLNVYARHNQRTLLDVRASYLFASPCTSVLYSDMYNHKDYVRMIVNSGFAGVNWSPELRETHSDAELIRRMQTTLMSSHMVTNSWYLSMPPWLQYDRDKNNKHVLLGNADSLELKAKKLIELRMQLLPYLYNAYAKYHFEGTPVFRALVMDYPNDEKVYKLDDEYMMGESILCAPFFDSASTRKIYLPKGEWFDFNTDKKYTGDSAYTITMSLDEIPMFIKNNSIIPLAAPVEDIDSTTTFDINCNVYGNPEPTTLFSDNSFTDDYVKGKYSWLTLKWNGKKIVTQSTGNYTSSLYKVNTVKHVQ